MFVCSLNTFSQDGFAMQYGQNDYVRLVGMSTSDYNLAIQNNFNSTVEGSPYLYKTWKNESKVYLGQKVYAFNTFNYNVYAERFEARISKDTVFIINTRGVDKVVLRNRVFKRYLDPEFQRNSYFEEIVKSKDFVLLRKYFAKIREANINPLTKVPEGLPRLIQNEGFYVLKGESIQLEKIKFKKSSILNLMAKNYIKEVQSFVKENNLKYSKLEDVTKILKFYNELGA